MQGPEHPLYKTQLCRHFVNGCCLREHCNFAHGEKELRHLPKSAVSSVSYIFLNGNDTIDRMTPSPVHKLYQDLIDDYVFVNTKKDKYILDSNKE